MSSSPWRYILVQPPLTAPLATYNMHTAGASEAKPIWSTCQGSTTFILAPPPLSPRKLVPVINATAAAKCQFVHPHPIGFFSAPQFERQSFFLRDRVQSSSIGLAAMIAWSSLPASFIISSSLSVLSFHSPHPPSLPLSLLQLNELFRKSAVHKDFMSVRVRNLAPSNSILAFVEAHFKPGKSYSRDLWRGSRAFNKNVCININ